METKDKENTHMKWWIAAGLSAMVFPGIGQLALGRKRAGITFITLAICTLAGVVVSILRFFQLYFSLITDVENYDGSPTSLMSHLWLPVLFFVLLGGVWIANLVYIFRCKPR